MNFQRLFEAIEYQHNKFGEKQDVFASKHQGTWVKMNSHQVLDSIKKLSAGLAHMGVSGKDYTPEGADKVGIISNNRPEWVITDIAVQQTGAILVPLYPTTNPLEVEFILKDSEVKYMFVSNDEMYQKIKEIQPRVPTLKEIFCFDEIEGCKHYTELFSLATPEAIEIIEQNKIKIPTSHLATLIYTSGTTGVPKGVMLSHYNLCQCVQFSKISFPFVDAPQSKGLSFLPLNHIFEKIITYIYLFSGISVYYAESLETIGENIREVKPNGFSCVPRLLEKVYEKIMLKGNELTGVKRKLFYWAVGLAEQYDNLKSKGIWYDFQLAIANKIIFNKWREALGGNIEYIITGGAACPLNLMRIFNAAKVPIYEGYGPTENSPVISVNCKTLGGQKFGTVGLPIKGIEVKLAEDGEILVKGPTVMQGYYKRPDLTAETIVDGWLLTGDIGTWDEGKYLKITDRKKELFKTSGGKYVAPQPIENKCKESAFIEQMLVLGADKKFVSALLVPNFLTLKDWMKEKGLNFTTPADVIQHPQVLQLYKDIIESFNPLFNHVEQVKKFELLPKEWSVETGEMTPKLSIKRKVIMEKYKDAVERIYANA